MTAISAGTITAYFLFDVADAIDLASVSRLVESTVPIRFTSKPPAPAYVQYRQPPITVDGIAMGTPSVDGFAVRAKVFDFGVISVAMTRPIPTSWDALLQEGLALLDNAPLAQAAQQACRALVGRIVSAVDHRRLEFLTEDYFVFSVTRFDPEMTAERLLSDHGGTIAQLLRGEREPLSPEELSEVLRHRLSYLASDLVVPTWNGAFVYDSEPGVQGALEILELANSQLLQFRYYDSLLDSELEGIYAQLQKPVWSQSWLGRRYTRAARHVHALFVDVNELTDRTENALKVAGDVYAARLLALAGSRLGLDHWKTAVRDKLKTLDDIYRFAVDQTAMTRGEILELTVVLILVVELVLFFAGLMH